MTQFSEDEQRMAKNAVGCVSMVLMVGGSIAILFFTDAPTWAKWMLAPAWGIVFLVSLAAWPPGDDD